jgi:cytochrome c553
MAPIVQRLGNRQIDAVSAYFATLQPSPRELHVP